MRRQTCFHEPSPGDRQGLRREQGANVPQGANTGLVGASSPNDSGTQIILSLDRHKDECSIDARNHVATVSSGVLLSDLNEKLSAKDLWFPVDLGANPTIGGMVATNTGGTRTIRYGDVRANLLSLEVVLFNPPGEVLRLGKALAKDNTGYDLKQLFVGTSGTIGVVTAAKLKVHSRPKQSATALAVPTSDAAVLALLLALESELGDFLSAFEGVSGNAISCVVAHVPSARNPFSAGKVLISRY